MDRDEAIARIRKALKARSGKTWSVKGGRGTAWGWITISASPARCNEFGYMPDGDRAELAELLGMGSEVHSQGVNVPASGDYYRLFVHCAEHGHAGDFKAQPYWD